MKQEDEEYEDENQFVEIYYYDEDLAELVFKRFGKIRFFGSNGTLPLGYKPFARVADSDCFGIVYGFLIAFINSKKNKFTIRYTNQYDPWGIHFLNKIKDNENEKKKKAF